MAEITNLDLALSPLSLTLAKNSVLQKTKRKKITTPYTKEEIKIIDANLPTTKFVSFADQEIDNLPKRQNQAKILTRKELWQEVKKT